jgi:hypothetical protein
LNTARDDRIEQKDEEAAYGEPGIGLFATAESGAVLRRVALSYVELRPSGQLTGGSPEIQGALQLAEVDVLKGVSFIDSKAEFSHVVLPNAHNFRKSFLLISHHTSTTKKPTMWTLVSVI